MEDNYRKALTEVLAILKYYLKQEEFQKIPKERILFFEKELDKEYSFEINHLEKLKEQKISIEAKSIIVGLYKEYFASNSEARILDELLILKEEADLQKNK